MVNGTHPWFWSPACQRAAVLARDAADRAGQEGPGLNFHLVETLDVGRQTPTHEVFFGYGDGSTARFGEHGWAKTPPVVGVDSCAQS